MFRIIIAEDEPLILRSICDKIRSCDPDFKIVGEYENGEYAMLELELTRPHVVLTDIYMPVKDGLSLIEHVKKHSPAAVCAVLTGYRDFEYAQQAIRLGVSNYLLKPPTNENVAGFLAEAKTKLIDNRTLIESELLQQWAFQKDAHLAHSPEIDQLALEHFYHARYVVLDVWTVPSAGGTPPKETDWEIESLLEDGEKAYAVPSLSTGRQVVVIGVHGLTNERMTLFAERLARCQRTASACVAVASVRKPAVELHGTLARLGKLAKAAYPLQGVRVLPAAEGESAFETKPLPVPGTLEQELLALLGKQRRTEFLNKLDRLFQLDAWAQATRGQWLQALIFRMNAWMHHYPDFARRAVETGWTHELEEVIGQAADYAGLREALKELHGSLFEAFEQDRDAEASWTEELKAYIDNHYMDNISLADLADRHGLNSSYLGRVFKQKYGHSPIDYLIQVRLTKARQLIREKPRLLFKDVAEMVGYSDPYYFSKLFKQWTGLTPREYKKLPAATE